MLDAPGGEVVPGEYVVGWIKRGPSGVIGTNKACASDTVAAMLEDAALQRQRATAAADPDAILDLLSERNPDFVTEKEWARLDAEERARGEASGRPRVKVVRVEQMLELMGKKGA